MFVGVLGNCAIAGELTGASNVDYRFARPRLYVLETSSKVRFSSVALSSVMLSSLKRCLQLYRPRRTRSFHPIANPEYLACRRRDGLYKLCDHTACPGLPA